jgi:hypothetical protein
LLQSHHPELLSSNINLTEHNCQILHNNIGQLQRVKREIRNKRKLETIEVGLNFMRIWILELTVLALDSDENAITFIRSNIVLIIRTNTTKNRILGSD